MGSVQWPPLYGGGFLLAVGQLAVFYYVLGAVLHYVIPAVINVQGIQEQPRKPGEVSRDAICSIGEQQQQQERQQAQPSLQEQQQLSQLERTMTQWHVAACLP